MKTCKICRVTKEKTDFYHNRAKCKECMNDPVRNRVKNLKKYGLTIEDFDRMLESQGGVCAICESHEPGIKGRFCVDHNHETGEVRGLLCFPCNSAIGQLQDSPRLLNKASNYLLERGFYGK